MTTILAGVLMCFIQTDFTPPYDYDFSNISLSYFHFQLYIVASLSFTGQCNHHQ